MARRLSWSDVRGGLIACAVLLVAVAAILRFSRVGALHGDTFLIYATVGDATGVTKGSEVWLSGQKIGKITDIRFRRPQSADTLHRVAIEMKILSRYRDALRHDAVGQIRSGGSFIGPPVVYLTPGTTSGAPIRPGDTVRIKSAPDLSRATTQLSAAAHELPVIMSNVQVLRAELETTRGTMGAFMNGPAMGQLTRARSRVAQLRDQMGGGGTVGRAMSGNLAVRAQRVMARADSVRTLAASPNSALGRFRRDSTLLSDVSDIRDELARLRSELDSPDGTVGRFTRDSAIALQLAESQHQMTLLFADIKKHPLRYLSSSF
jgi:phospholipid/cholesterol/gamma-HCH transport system substrate-binding protein